MNKHDRLYSWFRNELNHNDDNYHFSIEDADMLVIKCIEYACQYPTKAKEYQILATEFKKCEMNYKESTNADIYSRWIGKQSFYCTSDYFEQNESKESRKYLKEFQILVKKFNMLKDF